MVHQLTVSSVAKNEPFPQRWSWSAELIRVKKRLKLETDRGRVGESCPNPVEELSRLHLSMAFWKNSVFF
ncbi:hypothetical protein AMELA_G00095890 [Ameiurus melas]|uniref:Uncharacterized protein n=1 Tax=Ameiurus melas TaxID=219545 RepID=A0A7J6AVD0_AMEME|nr:hypothetical protein AMELA_G00095890 [Ameiurus melas]